MPNQQKSSPEKTSPTLKKNNNNIQMSYYFPSNSSHENTEKEAEFPTNINVNYFLKIVLARFLW